MAALYMICSGTFHGYGRIAVPAAGGLTLLFLALCLLAYFEGLQIAIVNAQGLSKKCIIILIIVNHFCQQCLITKHHSLLRASHEHTNPI